MVNLDQFFQDIQLGCKLIKETGSSELIAKAEVLETRLFANMDLMMEAGAQSQAAGVKIDGALVLQGPKADQAIAEFIAIKKELMTLGECFIIEAMDQLDPDLSSE